MEPSRRMGPTQWWYSAPRLTCSLPPCTCHKHGLRSGGRQNVSCLEAMHFHEQTVAPSSFIPQNGKPLLPQKWQKQRMFGCFSVPRPGLRTSGSCSSTNLFDMSGSSPFPPSSHRHSASVPQTNDSLSSTPWCFYSHQLL